MMIIIIIVIVHARTCTYTRSPKAVYEHEDVTLLCRQWVHTEREVMASRTDIIITNRKRENMSTDGCGSTCGQYHTKGSGR